MSLKPSNILVLGATGVIGQFIIASIISEKTHFGRIAIFTSPSTYENKSTEIQSLKDSGVEVIVGDVNNDADLLGAFKGFDTLICAFGRNVIEKQIDIIRLAEDSDIKWFFPSEYGTDIEYGPESSTEIPHQQKLKVRKYTKEHVKNMAYTYVVTGPYPELFISSFPDPKAGTFDLKSRTATIVGTGKDKVGFTTMPDVGKFVVAALKHPDVAMNRALKVRSFVASSDEIVAEYVKQTGKEWQVEYVSQDELREHEKKQWEAKNPSAALYALRRIWIEGGTLYDKWNNEEIGVKETETLSRVVAGEIQKGGGQAFRSGKLQ